MPSQATCSSAFSSRLFRCVGTSTILASMMGASCAFIVATQIESSRPIYCARPEPIAFYRIDNIGLDQGQQCGIRHYAKPHRRLASPKELNAGGCRRAAFAIVLQASIPERLATLMRKLDGDPDQHPEEVCDYWIIPTETQSGADHRGRRGIAPAHRRAAGGGRTRDN